MARKSALNRRLCNFHALALTISLSIEEVEGRPSGRGSKTITKKKDSSGITRCYSEEDGTIVEVNCPHTMSTAMIVGIAIGSLVGLGLLILVIYLIKKKIDARRRNLGAGNRDPEDKTKLVPPTLYSGGISNPSSSAIYPMHIVTPPQENTFTDKVKNALK